MSLNQAIGDHQTGTYSVSRTPERAYGDDGRLAAAGAPTILNVLASVQPASPEQLEDVPDGQSTSDAKLVLTETELRPRKEGVHEPDVITIDGRQYRIHSVEKWDHWGETHYECIALKLDTI